MVGSFSRRNKNKTLIRVCEVADYKKDANPAQTIYSENVNHKKQTYFGFSLMQNTSLYMVLQWLHVPKYILKPQQYW